MDKLNKGIASIIVIILMITIIPMLPENASFRMTVQFMSEVHLFMASSLKR